MYFASKDGVFPLRRPVAHPQGHGLAPLSALLFALPLLALHFLAFALLAWGQKSNATEDQVKAAYLVNFAKLAEWPATALPDGPSPLVIGVSGGDEDFLAVLKAVVAGKSAGTHPLAIKTVSAADDMKSCHIVFFRGSDKKRIHAAIEGMQPGVLFVGEDELFLREGGMINLVLDRGSVHFEVNADALDRSQIHFSSKILALAKAGSGPSHTTAPSGPAEGPRQVKLTVPPVYPELAQRMKLTGTVQVQALVKPDGTVKEVTVIGGHPLLAAAVVYAVKQWKYQSAPNETKEAVKFSFDPH